MQHLTNFHKIPVDSVVTDTRSQTQGNGLYVRHSFFVCCK